MSRNTEPVSADRPVRPGRGHPVSRPLLALLRGRPLRRLPHPRQVHRHLQDFRYGEPSKTLRTKNIENGDRTTAAEASLTNS
jgi:hypothetical protein